MMSSEEEKENLAQQHFGDDEPQADPGSQEQDDLTDEELEALTNPDPVSSEDQGGTDEEPETEEGEPPETEPASDGAPGALPRNEGESTRFYMARVSLAEYEKTMARKKPQTEASMVRQQRNLHGALSSVFTLPGEEQREAVNYVYRLFRDDATGAFAPAMVNRGLRELYAKDRGKALSLRAMVNIILRTLDPSSREETLQHIDLGPLLDEIEDKDVRAGIMEYLRIA